MNRTYTKEKIMLLKLMILGITFVSVFIFFVYGEFLIVLFNPIYDAEGYSTIYRVRFIFRPLIMLFVTLILGLIYFSIIVKLKPLFKYLTDGTMAKEARISMSKIPNIIMFYQIIIATLGTLIFYGISGWQTYSGFPFYFGLFTKFSLSSLSSIYAAFWINYTMKTVKQDLHIVDKMEGENDFFARIKDFAAMLASGLFLTSYLIYFSYYFSVTTLNLSIGAFTAFMGPVMLSMIIIAVLPLIISRLEFSYQIRSLLSKMQDIASGNISKSGYMFLFNFDELGEMSIYVNKILDKMRSLLGEINQIVDQLSLTSNSLTSVSEQSSSSSNQQAAAIAEIISTMEDSNSLSKSVGEKAMDVLEKSLSMQSDVELGNETISEHLTSSESVKEANEKTIDFIKTLNTDIKTIWEVVTIINSIADQVKIIAFNAELEASSAGEAGKNFEIVASEIRRLADKTVASTSEIRNKIFLIEKAGQSLMSASQTATGLIEQGWRLSSEAGNVFSGISNSSTETTTAAKSIETNIRMQIQGFEQILLAMKQISDGATDFSESTTTTLKTAASLAELVEILKKVAEEDQSNKELDIMQLSR